MKNRQSKLLIYLPIMLILTAVAVVFRSVALSVDFNFESGYYTDKTVLEHCTEMKRLLIASLNTAKSKE